MSIQNYGELKTAVSNWLKKTTLDVRIPEFIELAENQIYNELDLPAIEAEVTLTIDNRNIALPSDFLEQRRHYIDVTEPVQRVTYMAPETLWDYDSSGWAGSSGFPRFYTIEGNDLVFAPTPDDTYTGKWLYLARNPRLADDADTNTILQVHTGLYLYGSLLQAEGFLADDPRILTWASKYENAMDLAQDLGRRQRFPKGQKVMRSRVPVSSGGRTKM
ncbi:MAG: phage adaptor protein [Geminicoccaceae bacterium]